MTTTAIVDLFKGISPGEVPNSVVWPVSAFHQEPRTAPIQGHGAGSSIPIETASDEALVRQIVAGNPDPYSELVRRYSPRLFATVRRHLRREDDVQDVVQDILVKAYDRLASFRGEAPFEHWLMRIAIRTCYDALRARRRRREITVTELSRDEVNWLEHQMDRQGGDSSSDAEAAKSIVQRVFERLAPQHQLILVLLEIEERTIKEIAAMTGWSVPLVKVRAFRARAEMRKVIRAMKLGLQQEGAAQ